MKFSTSGAQHSRAALKSKPTTADSVERAARTAASTRAKQIEAYAKTVRFKSWVDLETRFNVSVPASFKQVGISYATVLDFLKHFIEDAVATSLAVVPAVTTAPAIAALPKSADLEDITVGTRKLRPRQKKALWKIKNALFTRQESRACLCPMNTGSGKTIIAAALISDMQRNGYYGLGNPFGMYNVIYFVPAAVKIKTTRELAKCGIKDIGTDVLVFAYSDLNAKTMAGLFKTEVVVDPFNKETKEVYKFAIGAPAMVIFDESHRLKNRESKTARKALGLINPKSRFLFMSATPAIVVDDLRMFGLASAISWGGAIIDEISWKDFAWQVGKSNPSVVNDSSISRVFDWFDERAGCVINPPADPRKVKSHNGVKFIDFLSAESKARYDSAQDRWLELCEKQGHIPSERGAILVAFQNFRRAAELEAAPIVAKLAIETHAAGRAPVIACVNKETIKTVVAELAKSGVSRDKISIIWGGEPEITEKDVLPMLDWIAMMKHADDPTFVWPSRADRARFNKSTYYWTVMFKADRNVAAQREMDRWLQDMRLFKQNAEQRQTEIDRFQDGITEYCLFTLAAGGTGIDLDHQVEGIRPRTLFAFPCYYAEEFIQAFGRIYREFTLSDAYQYVVLFRNTIVTEHVAPKLAKKLAAVHKATGAGLNLESALTDAATKHKLERNIGLPLDDTLETTDEIVVEDDEEEEE